MNSSTSPRWSRYFSRRCCLQMSAVCFCRFLVPNPILCTGFLYRILTAVHHARDFLLLNLAIISSAVSSPFLTFSTTVLNAKPSLGPESINHSRLDFSTSATCPKIRCRHKLGGVEEFHGIADAHGVRLDLRANGFVFTNRRSMIHVKASSIDRRLAKTALEAHAPPFQGRSRQGRWKWIPPL